MSFLETSSLIIDRQLTQPFGTKVTLYQWISLIIIDVVNVTISKHTSTNNLVDESSLHVKFIMASLSRLRTLHTEIHKGEEYVTWFSEMVDGCGKTYAL